MKDAQARILLHLKENHQKRLLSFQRIKANQEHLRVHLLLHEILRLHIGSHWFLWQLYPIKSTTLGTVNVRSSIVEALRSRIWDLMNDRRSFILKFVKLLVPVN